MIETAGLFGESAIYTTDMDHKEGTSKLHKQLIKNDNVQCEGVTKLANGDLAMLLKDQAGTSSTAIAFIDRQKDSVDQKNIVLEGARGITFDPTKNILYISNGSKTIARVDPTTLETKSEFNVHYSEEYMQSGITELEFAEGYIWASVKYYMGMIQIDPDSGKILNKISFHPLH